MKITKKMLRDIIKEEMTSIKELAGPSPDVNKIDVAMERAKISKYISTNVNTPEEFIQLINLIIGDVEKLKPDIILTALKKAIGTAQSNETPTTTQSNEPPTTATPTTTERRIRKRK